MLFLPAERGTEETDSTTVDFARVCNLLLKKKRLIFPHDSTLKGAMRNTSNLLTCCPLLLDRT